MGPSEHDLDDWETSHRDDIRHIHVNLYVYLSECPAFVTTDTLKHCQLYSFMRQTFVATR